MIEFLLAVHVCSSLTAVCAWEVRSIHRSEAGCAGEGLRVTVIERRNIEFVCVRTKDIADEAIPTLLVFDGPVPLPVKRPNVERRK